MRTDDEFLREIRDRQAAKKDGRVAELLTALEGATTIAQIRAAVKLIKAKS